jgi:hypothetical protein
MLTLESALREFGLAAHDLKGLPAAKEVLGKKTSRSKQRRDRVHVWYKQGDVQKRAQQLFGDDYMARARYQSEGES